MIEILTASKEHDADAIRAGLAESRPGFKIEAMTVVGDEWNIRISDDDNEDKKPAFLDGGDDSEDKSDSDDDSKSDSGEEKSEKKDDGEKSEKSDKKDSDGVSKLRDLVQQLQQTMDEVVQNAEEVASDADGKQQKMEEIHDSVKEHVNGDGEKGGDMPLDAPLPEDAVGLEDIGPTPGAPGAGGPPKAPAAPKAPAMPRKKPVGVPGGGPSGIPAFTNVQVATHPGVDEKGERISLVAAAHALETDPEFEEYEVIGMVENRDGTYSAKLKPKK